MRLNIEMKNDKSRFGSKNLYKRITDQFSCFGSILLQRGFFLIDKTRGNIMLILAICHNLFDSVVPA